MFKIIPLVPSQEDFITGFPKLENHVSSMTKIAQVLELHLNTSFTLLAV